jgi:ABC-type transporter Mla subunit MlaD
MRPVVRDFLTGLTAIIGIGGLLGMLFMFKEINAPGDRFTRFAVRMDNAGGVDAPDPVMVNGVKVGQVEEALVDDRGALLLVRIRSHILIPKAATVRAEQGLVGNSALEFVIDPEMPADIRKVVIKDRTQEPDFIFDGGRGSESLTSRMESMLADPVARLKLTADRIDELASTYTDLGKRLSDMVEPRTLADVAAGKTPNLRTSLERVDRAVAAAEVWLDDETLLNRLKAGVERAEELLTEADSLLDTWNRTGVTVANEVTKSREEFTEMMGNAEKTLSSAQNAADSMAALLDGIKRGEGTAGQLATNPDLYNSIKSAADRLDTTLLEIRLLAEKYRREGLPIRIGG